MGGAPRARQHVVRGVQREQQLAVVGVARGQVVAERGARAQHDVKPLMHLMQRLEGPAPRERGTERGSWQRHLL